MEEDYEYVDGDYLCSYCQCLLPAEPDTMVPVDDEVWDYSFEPGWQCSCCRRDLAWEEVIVVGEDRL